MLWCRRMVRCSLGTGLLLRTDLAVLRDWRCGGCLLAGLEVLVRLWEVVSWFAILVEHSTQKVRWRSVRRRSVWDHSRPLYRPPVQPLLDLVELEYVHRRL